MRLFDSTNVKQANIPFGSLGQSIDAQPIAANAFDSGPPCERRNWLEMGAPSSGFASIERYRMAKLPVGAFDNMQDRPIRGDQWKHFEIVGQIDDDAAKITLGLILPGYRESFGSTMRHYTLFPTRRRRRV